MSNFAPRGVILNEIRVVISLFTRTCILLNCSNHKLSLLIIGYKSELHKAIILSVKVIHQGERELRANREVVSAEKGQPKVCLLPNALS